MAAAEAEEKGGAPPQVHPEDPTTTAHPLSQWAIHHHEEAPPPPPSAPPYVQPSPASGEQQPPYALPYPAEQPIPLNFAQQPYPPYPGPGFALQPYPGPQQQQPPPFPQLTQPTFPQPYPQPPFQPPADPTPSALQSSGPRLEAPTVNAWTVCALLLNGAFIAATAFTVLGVGGSRQTMGAAAGVLYAVYLGACLCSPSAIALRNHVSTMELLALTQELRSQRPDVWAAIVCFHYEHRTRRVTRKSSNGRSHTHTEHYTEKVVTHRARASWGYRGCRDTSGPPVYEPHLPMVEIHFKPVQDFFDAASHAAFEGWRAQFLEANRRDSHQDVSGGMDVPGLRPYVMLQQGTSWLIGPGAHTLAVIVGLGIFYECAVFQRTPHAKYCACACSSSSRPPPCAFPARGALTHPPPLLLPAPRRPCKAAQHLLIHCCIFIAIESAPTSHS